MTLWPVALITFKEGIRNKALYGITLIALILFGATALIANYDPERSRKSVHRHGAVYNIVYRLAPCLFCGDQSYGKRS